MADDKKISTPTMDSSLQSEAGVERQKRELIRRRDEVKAEMEKLKADVSAKDDAAPRQQLQNMLQQEIDRQTRIKKEIEEGRKAIRELRKEKSSFAERRNEITEGIRVSQIQKRELQQVASSDKSSESEKEDAKKQLNLVNEEILVQRRDEAEQSAEVSRRSTAITSKVGEVEYAQGDLSQSRKASKAVKNELENRSDTEDKFRRLGEKDKLLGSDINDYDQRQREKARSNANRFSPQMLMSQARSDQPHDSEFEALKAGSQIRKAGGTGSEAAQVTKAALEFNQLFDSIKQTKKALAELTQGTEEHSKKQEELTSLESSAAEAVSKMDKVSRDIEKRGMIGGAGSKWYQPDAKTGFNALSGAASFAGQGFERLGGLATDRYVLEEQKKQSQYNLSNMALTDTRNRTRDATSFLSTGGGNLFGAETPFGAKTGRPNAAISALGEDYANTQRAVPQYGVVARAAEGLGRAGANIAGDAMAGEGINPLTGGVGSLAGSAVKNLGAFGLNTMQDALYTPEFGAGMGGKKAAGAMRGVNDAVIGGATELAQGTMGSLISQGGGNGDLAVQGIGRVGAAGQKLANGLPNVMTRGYEAVDERQKLVETEQTAAQAGRVRERLGMAFAPAMQQYMDVQGTQKNTMRNSVMSKAEREGYEGKLEKFSMDSELGDRGFGTADILGQTNQASRGFGRFGAGGMNERVAKGSLMAESMGLGSAQQSTTAMSKMLTGGVKDPEAMFTKAVKEGLEKGLQDSREFQGLLDAATSSADSASGFEGTLNNLMKLTGSGRANDVQTVKAAYSNIEKDMSGFSGDWTDMVKFDITNRAAKSVVQGVGGDKLDREDRTSLQNLANFKPQDLQNTELVKNSLTPNALKAVEAQGGIEKYTQKLNTSMMVHGQMDRAINSTQSKDLVQVRNMIDSGDDEGLKKMFAGSEGKAKLDKILSQNLSGQSSNGGNMDAALGLTQGLANTIGQKIGMDPQSMRLMNQKYERKDAAKVKADSGAANTMGEQMDRGDAQVSQQNMSLITGAGRDAKGKNLFAADMSRTGANYAEQQSKMVQNVQNDRTVKPENRVERIDDAVGDIVKGLQEIKESFKNFSPKDMVINAGKDVVIQGANAIKGVMLDNGLTQAATEAGKAIADTVRGAFGGGGNSTPAPKAAGTSKSVPGPQGT